MDDGRQPTTDAAAPGRAGPVLPESWFRARFEVSTVAQAFCDLDGVLTLVNGAFCTLLGRPARDLVGRSVGELAHRTDPGNADPSLRDLLAGAHETLRSERVLGQPDGRPVPVLVNLTLLRGESGRPAGAAAVFEDLTRLHGAERRRQQQEDFFLALAQRASDLAVVADVDGRILYSSPAVTTVLGHRAEDVLFSRVLDLVHPDDVAAGAGLFEQVLATGGPDTVSLRVRDATGEWHWVEQTVTNLLDTAVGGMVLNLRDVTDRVRTEEALRASEHRYRAIADNADEGLWVTAPDGRTVYANTRLLEILGLPAEEVLGQRLLDVLGEAHAGGPADLSLAGAVREPERYEVGYRHPDGRWRTLSVSECALDDVGGTLEGSLAMVSDVTEARQLEGELRRAALHDSLTGLPNRALLLDRLEHALRRDAGITAVLFVDLDHFKMVNDARGHTAGDTLLVAVAARLRASARTTDTVARFGGDEFLVVCEDVDESLALSIADGLQEALSPPFLLDDGEVHLSASVGVALSFTSSAAAGTATASATALLRDADTAMYAAKEAGRNRVRLFDAPLAASASERYELGLDLRRAIAEDELRLHYQPVIDLRTGAVVGVEALARWTHPALGEVPPARFVAVAEDVGLAPALDRWALARACREVVELRASGDLPETAALAVNISARTLGDPGVEDWVMALVADSGLDPQEIVLEVTESAIMSDPASAVDQLTGLRRRGLQVAVDDFGTGHSSLAYLRTLPLAVLKVDRSFITELISDASALAITGSIIELAHAVGLDVVAEGVETSEHARLLRSLGAEYAQGWLWSPAVSPEEARRTGAFRRSYDV